MTRFRKLTKESDGFRKMTNGEKSVYVDDEGIDAMKKKGYWLVKDKPSPYFQDECQMTEDSGDDITADIKDVERMYGKDVANGLLEYCKLFKKRPGQVMNDLSEDGNGQTEWDKFDIWLKKKKGIDFTGGFGDYSIDDEIKKQREREKSAEVDVDKFERKMAKIRKGFGSGKPKRRYVSRNRFKESSGDDDKSGIIMFDLADYIGYSNWAEDCYMRGGNLVVTVKGRNYIISIRPESSGESN